MLYEVITDEPLGSLIAAYSISSFTSCFLTPNLITFAQLKRNLMLELNYIRENAAEVAARLAIKNIDAAESLQKIIEIDARRREAQRDLDENLTESNAIARKVGELFNVITSYSIHYTKLYDLWKHV